MFRSIHIFTLFTIAACSSSSMETTDAGTPPAGGSGHCENYVAATADPALSDACASCEVATCPEDINAVTLSCPGIGACWEACDCSDSLCIDQCVGDVPACQNAVATLRHTCDATCADVCR